MRRPKASLLLLILLGLMPWVWAGLGRWLGSYGWLVALYHGLGCLLPALILGRFRWIPPKPSVWLPYGQTIFLIGFILLGWGWWLEDLVKYDHFLESLNSLSFSPYGDSIAFGVYFLLMNPILEEMFWRGTLYPRMKTHLGTPKAMVLNAGLFASWHWLVIEPFFEPLGQVLAVSSVFVAGLIFTYLFDRQKAVLPVAIVHSAGCDLPICLIFWQIIIRLGLL